MFCRLHKGCTGVLCAAPAKLLVVGTLCAHILELPCDAICCLVSAATALAALVVKSLAWNVSALLFGAEQMLCS